METEGSLPHSQVPATCACSEYLILLPPKRNSVKQCTEALDLCNVRSFSFPKWIPTATTEPTPQFHVNILLAAGVCKYQYWVISCG